jgi:hypothetical protein
MIPVSDAFLAALKVSHTIATDAFIYKDGIYYALPIPLVEANVNISDQLIRRAVTLSFVDPTGEFTPSDARDLFMPLGTEIVLARGVKFADGTQELCSLGVFGFADVKISDSGSSITIDIDGYDRGRRIQRARMNRDYGIALGTNYVDAIQALLHDRWPDIETNFPTTSYTTPSLLLEQSKDPWEFAYNMARDIGYDLFFDRNGVCVMSSTINTGAPVLEFTDGVDGTLLNLSKRFQNDDVYSHVVVTGENTNNVAPVRGEAFDDNPNSPTYYQGPFGDVTYFYSSGLITTTNQALATARNMVPKVTGILEALDFNSLVNPALALGDRISVVRDKIGVSSIYSIEKITVPYTHDRGMFIVCKKRTLDM